MPESLVGVTQELGLWHELWHILTLLLAAMLNEHNLGILVELNPAKTSLHRQISSQSATLLFYIFVIID